MISEEIRLGSKKLALKISLEGLIFFNNFIKLIKDIIFIKCMGVEILKEELSYVTHI